MLLFIEGGTRRTSFQRFTLPPARRRKENWKVPFDSITFILIDSDKSHFKFYHYLSDQIWLHFTFNITPNMQKKWRHPVEIPRWHSALIDSIIISYSLWIVRLKHENSWKFTDLSGVVCLLNILLLFPLRLFVLVFLFIFWLRIHSRCGQWRCN